MVNVFFKTYGCQANVADSEGLMVYLSDLGCKSVSEESAADLIFINSCAVRQKAEQKMFSYLGSLAAFKKVKPYMRIGVIGCVASYKKKEIYERYDHVNFVFGAKEQLSLFKNYLYDLIVQLETSKQLFETNPHADVAPGQDREISSKTVSPIIKPFSKSFVKKDENEVKELKRSFVNIMTGCNKYCSYCIVPFTRGREVSYSIDEILERIQKDLFSGAKEVTLIGQNVNSYICPQTGAKFAKLLEEVSKFDGDYWVRYVSPHPQDMTLDVLETMAKYRNKLCAWVHLPLQSGSDKILQSMNRTYSVERYMQIVDWINQLLPNAAISTDIIVGFPGENEEDYNGTRDVMEKVKYHNIFSFIYSKRKYTKAYNLENNLTPEVCQQRLEALQARQHEICLQRNSEFVGKQCKVLVEKRLENDKLLARNEGNIRVVLSSNKNLVNQFVDAKITSAGVAQLEADLL